MASSQDQHFANFQKILSSKIVAYGEHQGSEKDFIKSQKKQVLKLSKLEEMFRKELLRTPHGLQVYMEFINFIRDDRKNILDARPYFRIRQDVFTKKVSPALRTRDPKNIQKCHFNFTFISFAMKYVVLSPNDPLTDIYEELKEVRNKLIEVNTPLAIARSSQFYRKTKRNHLTRMDLIQVALEGLTAGIDKFCGIYDNTKYRHMLIGRITGNLIEAYCIDENTILNPIGQPPKKISEFIPGDKILGIDDSGAIIETEVVALHDHGVVDGYEVEFADGYKIICSKNHKFLTEEGQIPIHEIVSRGLGVLCEPTNENWWLDNSLPNGSTVQEKDVCSQKSMSNLQNTGIRDPALEWAETNLTSNSNRRMEKSVRSDFSNTSIVLQSQKKLSGLSKSHIGGTCRKGQELAEQEHGTCSRAHAEYFDSISGVFTKKTRPKIETHRKGETSFHGMEVEESRGIHPQHEKSLGRSETIQDGSVVTVKRNYNLGRCSNQMRKGKKAGGLRFSGSQNMGRSGWELSLQRSIDEAVEAEIAKDSATGCHVEDGGPIEERCDFDPISGGLFLCDWHTKRALEGVAIKHAPLTSTRGLVLRKVVRFSPMGTRRMYDLEVAHPKHNFLLPNGIVTSNSETMVHFYPTDKRKLYNANKVMNKCRTEDFQEISARVNDLAKEHLYTTTPEEVTHLVAASNLINADFSPPAHSGDNQTKTIQDTMQYADVPEKQPDIGYEAHELSGKLAQAIRKLTVFEQKLLRLKGMEF